MSQPTDQIPGLAAEPLQRGTGMSAAKTLADMTAEIREVNIAKGWRPAQGGPGSNTFGDYVALLHSEVSEALEAYRDHRLEDATTPADPLIVDGLDLTAGRLPKPEGVGSEFADVLIRSLDMADVFGIKVRNMALSDWDPSGMESFGDHLAWLHYLIANLIEPDDADEGWQASYQLSELVWSLYFVTNRYGIDLDFEYERKIAYNRTRPYQHGGRTLADSSEAMNGRLP